MEQREFMIPDQMGFHDTVMPHENKHYLKGVIEISRRNKLTGEIIPVERGTNIIPISGMQWVLMKMFGLYLDAPHAVPYEKLDKDTNLIIPELNQSSSNGIGQKPENYSTMNEPISSKHICQGFMVGNGGSGEDQLTTKNTDYSFVSLRNPIPFQQGDLSSEIAGQYLGVFNKNTSPTKSYYIKKFDETPHIYHSWWKDGQRWNYIDPVTPDDLGPNAPNGAGKTDRIETYAECKLTISEDDFIAFFNHDGNTQTPAINEIGLVAFDTTADGDRSILEELYTTHIKDFLNIVFDNNRREPEEIEYMKTLASEILEVLSDERFEVYHIADAENQTLHHFMQTLETVETTEIVDVQDALSESDNLGVVALYDRRGNYQYETDGYLEALTDPMFDNATTNEAQRIKLITYYTFKSIPLEENFETLFNYRIYAN